MGQRDNETPQSQGLLRHLRGENSRLIVRKHQYFGHMMRKPDSLEKTLMLEKIEGRWGGRGWDGWIASPIQWTMSLSKLRETVKEREAWKATVPGMTKCQTQRRDWIKTTILIYNMLGCLGFQTVCSFCYRKPELPFLTKVIKLHVWSSLYSQRFHNEPFIWLSKHFWDKMLRLYQCNDNLALEYDLISFFF